MRIDVLNTPKLYTDFLLRQDKTNILSSIKFGKFLLDMTGANPNYLVAREGCDILGVLPAFISPGKYGNVINSLPWFGSNPGVIVDDKLSKSETNNIINALLNSLFNYAAKIDCLSATFCGYPGINFDEYESFFQGYEISERIGMITNLPNYDDNFIYNLFRTVHQKTRNQIRKSFNNCMAICAERGKSLSSQSVLNWLLAVHKKNMEAIGAPVKSREFEVMKDWILGHGCDLFIAYHRQLDIPIAGLFVQYFNKTVDYVMPVIVEEYRSLNPLHSLITVAMEDAAARGFKYWNWGGTKLPEMQGVYHFKKNWGAVEYPYRYYTRLFKPLPKDITKEDLIKEYPYFYVYPFDKL